MKYTRSECAHLLGISMDALRYYEGLGIVSASKHAGSGRRLYAERDVMALLAYRKMKSMGLSGEELKDMFTSQDASALVSFEATLDRLQAMEEDLHAKIAYIRGLQSTFDRISGELDTVRIGVLPERRFLLLTQENEEWIREAMAGLPYLNYGYWIDRRCLTGELPWALTLAVDICALREPCPAMYDRLNRSGRVLSNGAGMKVYCYRSFPNISDLQPSDFLPLVEFAREHRFDIRGDVFGGILGPHTFMKDSSKGYVLTQTLEIG